MSQGAEVTVFDRIEDDWELHSTGNFWRLRIQVPDRVQQSEGFPDQLLSINMYHVRLTNLLLHKIYTSYLYYLYKTTVLCLTQNPTLSKEANRNRRDWRIYKIPFR